MITFRTLALVVLGAAAFASPLTAQTASASPNDPSLRAGDVLRVSIWREPELSGEFVVSPTNTVTLPLLGPVEVGDVPIGILVERLIAEYRAQIRNPSITILPLRQIFLLGDIARPGVYSVPPSTTLAAAVTLAGGPNAIGDINKISLVREGTTIFSDIPMDQAIHVVDIRSSDQIYVGRVNWMRRNATYVVGLGLTLFTILLPILR